MVNRSGVRREEPSISLEEFAIRAIVGVGISVGLMIAAQSVGLPPLAFGVLAVLGLIAIGWALHKSNYRPTDREFISGCTAVLTLLFPILGGIQGKTWAEIYGGGGTSPGIVDESGVGGSVAGIDSEAVVGGGGGDREAELARLERAEKLRVRRRQYLKAKFGFGDQMLERRLEWAEAQRETNPSFKMEGDDLERDVARFLEASGGSRSDIAVDDDDTWGQFLAWVQSDRLERLGIRGR